MKIEKILQLILEKMKDINYGFVDNNKNIYPDNEENWNKYGKDYILQSPETLLNSKHGVCWDQVELERYYLEKNNIKFSSYFIVNYDNKIFPTHTFIIVKNKDKLFWIEYSWKPHRGIHEYNTLNDALKDIKNKFDEMIKSKYNINNNETIIYEYKKPNYNISSIEFFKHCEKGIKESIK